MIISELSSNANTIEELSKYLELHFEQVYEYFTHQKYTLLMKEKNNLRLFLKNHRSVINSLDLSNRTQSSFIVLLIGVCEQLGLLSEFRFLYQLMQKSKFNPGKRIEAAALFLIDIRNAEDYIDRYDSIIEYLIYAYREEEDNGKNVTTTLVNYYGQVVYNFGQFNKTFVQKFQSKIQYSIQEIPACNLLNSTFLQDVLNIDINNFRKAYSQIQDLTDKFLQKKEAIPLYVQNSYLIEKNTDYAAALVLQDKSFSAIRNLSIQMCKNHIDDENEVFYSLERGIAILTERSQLAAYMKSYGKMHYAKLNSAFEALSFENYDDNIHVIDWGCGQGLASLVYVDYLKNSDFKKNIQQITLIEPSIVAIKRASLHVKHMIEDVNIYTVNKDFDSLKSYDFSTVSCKVNLHLFSNILDMDSFSIEKLVKHIREQFHGKNYFICVSPYVTDLKTAKIDAFAKYFNKFDNFKMIYEVDNKKGEWKNDWSRVIRIFSVEL